MQLNPETTVRELLERHPSAVDALIERGMCPSCRENPPAVSLRHFADKHCDGQVQALIEVLNGSIGS